MRNNIKRNSGKRPPLAVFFLFALVCAVLATQNLGSSASNPPSPDQPVRVTLVRKNFYALPAGAKDLELDFAGANGTVTRLSATNGKQTFKFERGGEALLSCPKGKVKECDSLSLKAGGQLTACACLPPGPMAQTKEHILLARQVGVPAMMTESSQPGKIAADPASETSYEIALSDKSMLRATPNSERTCWINKKLPMSLCY